MHFWLHCVKTVQIQGYLWSIFSCIWTEYRKIRTRNNSVFGHFSRSSFAHNFQEDQLYRTLLGNIFSIAASCTFWKVFQIFYIFCMETNAWQFESKINWLVFIWFSYWMSTFLDSINICYIVLTLFATGGIDSFGRFFWESEIFTEFLKFIKVFGLKRFFFKNLYLGGSGPFVRSFSEIWKMLLF